MKIVVIGGGISGLSSAYRIAEVAGSGAEITVLESDERIGGKIQTEVKDGWVVEAGPNGFLDNKPATMALARDVGLGEEIVPADARSKVRFLYLDGRLVALPTSPPKFLTSPALPLSGRLRVLLEPWRPRGPADETVAEFGRRRLGRHVVERLLDPFVSGVFAGDVERLSVTSAFPTVKALETEHGSLIRGMRAKRKAGTTRGGPAGPGGHLHTIAGGLHRLLERVAERLPGTVRTGVPVVAVVKDGERYRVRAGGETLDADFVVSAATGPAAAGYLSALDPELAAPLAATPYASVAVVAVGLTAAEAGDRLGGFGFLVPSREDRRILGVLWTSSIYPGLRAPDGHVLLRTIVGGARHPELALLTDEELVELVQAEHSVTMNLHWQDPAYLRVFRWPEAIPQYEVGHGARLADLDARLAARYPGLVVTGNHLHGVGMNDCTQDALRVAEHFRSWQETRRT